MGTFKLSRLTSAEIVERYQGGECMGLLSLRARKPQAWIKDVLLDAGVVLRTPKQYHVSGIAGSKTLKPRRAPAPAGTNPWGQP